MTIQEKQELKNEVLRHMTQLLPPEKYGEDERCDAIQNILEQLASDGGISDVSEWRFLANENPSAEGWYEVLDIKGQTEKVLYGCSGFMGEPVSFFEGRKVRAKDIIAFR